MHKIEHEWDPKVAAMWTFNGGRLKQAHKTKDCIVAIVAALKRKLKERGMQMMLRGLVGKFHGQSFAVGWECALWKRHRTLNSFLKLHQCESNLLFHLLQFGVLYFKQIHGIALGTRSEMSKFANFSHTFEVH